MKKMMRMMNDKFKHNNRKNKQKDNSKTKKNKKK